MPFGFFKKKKKEEEEQLHYDPTNIGVMDIRKGWVFEYDLKTWEVTEEYEYDWGDNYFTYEFKIVSAEDTRFFSVEKDDEITCQVVKKINFGKLPEEVEKKLVEEGKPPRSIVVDGQTFFRESERPGYFRNIDSDNWDEFISWDYYDENEKFVLNIEQWGESEFEASLGVVEEERAFSNILPV
jgi:hypothetical protein